LLKYKIEDACQWKSAQRILEGTRSILNENNIMEQAYGVKDSSAYQHV